jgi:hypothetical protein
VAARHLGIAVAGLVLLLGLLALRGRGGSGPVPSGAGGDQRQGPGTTAAPPLPLAELLDGWRDHGTPAERELVEELCAWCQAAGWPGSPTGWWDVVHETRFRAAGGADRVCLMLSRTVGAPLVSSPNGLLLLAPPDRLVSWQRIGSGLPWSQALETAATGEPVLVVTLDHGRRGGGRFRYRLGPDVVTELGFEPLPPDHPDLPLWEFGPIHVTPRRR